MKVVIITGGSKGIGKALSLKYYNEGYYVYSIARTKTKFPEKIKQISCDLTDINSLLTNFNLIFNEISLSRLTDITLINNAGRLGKISSLNNIPANDINLSIQLNVTAVLVLSGLFINNLYNISCNKSIINLSSGAAVNPYPGWSVYCASKAAVDMLTKVTALEQENVLNPVKIFAVRPGVVATGMQKQIRNTDKKDFKLVDKFIELDKKNLLSNPDTVADKMFKIDTGDLVENGQIIDLRDFIF